MTSFQESQLLKWLVLKKLPRVTTFNLVFQEPLNDYKYMTMTRISNNWFQFNYSQHLSMSFCSILSLSRKVHWPKTCAILLLFSFFLLPKEFKELTVWEFFWFFLLTLAKRIQRTNRLRILLILPSLSCQKNSKD